MPHANAFLAAILETPDDDTPRLVYADWLDEQGDSARAEFIRAQVSLARLAEDDPRRDDLERRERLLLAEHRDHWLAPLPPWARKKAVFRRGFVEEVTGRAAQFVKGARALFESAPVRRAWLTYPLQLGAASHPDPALAACPFLGRLTALKLGGAFGGPVGDAGLRTLVASPHLTKLGALDLSGNRHTAEGMRAVAESPHLPALTALDLSNDVWRSGDDPGGDEGAMALAASPRLAGLRELGLGRSRVGPAGAAALAGSPHLARLTSLNLEGNAIGPRGTAALAASPHLSHLAALNLNGARMGAAAAGALLTSPHLPRLCDVHLSAADVTLKVLGSAFAGAAGARLTRLALDHGRLGDEVFSVLAPLRLRSLGLRWTGIGPDGARLLAGLPLLEGLRELDLRANRLGDEGVRALAESPRAGNLRVLDLYANDVGPAGAEALAASPHLARLRVLNLVGNKLGNAGGRSLGAAPHLHNLAGLRLHGNRIVKAVKDELARRFGGVVDF